MYTLAKRSLIVASALTGVVLTIFIIAMTFKIEGLAFLTGWYFIAALLLWMPVAGICILTMAVTYKNVKEGSNTTKQALILRWLIIAFLLFLAQHLTKSYYLSAIWRRDFRSVAWELWQVSGGLLSFISAMLLVFRKKLFFYSMTLLIFTLFISINYFALLGLLHGLAIYSSQRGIGVFLMNLGVKNFTLMIAFASYVYLSKTTLTKIKA